MKWDKGRQDANYHKKRLWQVGINRLGLFSDCYLIKYPPDAKLPPHKDPVESGRHWRLNIELKGSGEFLCDGASFKLWRITLFRPDINTHAMNNGPSERLVLSFGFRF